MQADPLLLVAVPIVGFASGFINTLAGSGSLITLPLLIVLGLPANVANGTNRVGILVQTIVSVATFRGRNAMPRVGVAKVVVPSVLGAAVGAALAVDLDEAMLRRTIGVLMLVMLVVVIARPRRWLESHETGCESSVWLQAPLFFAIGAYGGFIQAGVGIFLLAGLVLGGGFTLVGGNAVKNLIVLIFTVAALAVFVANDQVRWGLGALLAAGSAAGAWAAARMAISRGAPFVRTVLIVILVLSAIAMLGDIRLADGIAPE
ncbi:MAG TPA: sulfite exporter TauE/SafE family protein [Gammaproteobacteria bacterium]